MKKLRTILEGGEGSGGYAPGRAVGTIINNFPIERVFALRKAGISDTEIAKRLGATQPTIKARAEKHTDHPNFHPPVNIGKSPHPKEIIDNIVHAHFNKNMSYGQIKKHLYPDLGRGAIAGIIDRHKKENNAGN